MSHLPPSSFPRGTPSSVPASQNTAPVIKFRCLYTHDVRRKAKRWQDGYLKFHTFNKRAMVYDDAGNFIGDHHWRDSNEIQDGDELELDKGVLIQVSECMERTQTDISALFEKRKASQESPQQDKSSAPPSSRTPLPSRTGPPKSLNDLLGIKRPSIGRAVAPRSPYEQRHPPPVETQIQQQQERPTKRQKQQPIAEISVQNGAPGQFQSSPEIIDLEDSAPRANAAGSLPNEPLGFSVPRVVNKHHESPIVSKDVTSKPRSKEPTVTRQETVGVPESVRAPVQNQAKAVHRELPSRTPIPSERTQAQPDRSRLGTDKPKTPINPLRICIEKPRQKLMYKAHLPPKASNNITSETGQASSNPFNTGAFISESNSDFDISASTLAVLEEMNGEVLLGNARAAGASTPDSILPKESTSQLARTRALYRIPSHTAIHGSAASPGGIELGDDHIPPPSSQIHIQQPSNSLTHTEGHILSRSHSDLSVMLSDSRPVISAPERPVPEPSVAENPAPISRRAEPKVFRKSYSDTSALRNEAIHNHGPSLPLATDRPPRRESNHDKHEQGPWTAEALDFFDWWPPGRPKP